MKTTNPSTQRTAVAVVHKKEDDRESGEPTMMVGVASAAETKTTETSVKRIIHAGLVANILLFQGGVFALTGAVREKISFCRRDHIASALYLTGFFSFLGSALMELAVDCWCDDRPLSHGRYVRTTTTMTFPSTGTTTTPVSGTSHQRRAAFPSHHRRRWWWNVLISALFISSIGADTAAFFFWRAGGPKDILQEYRIQWASAHVWFCLALLVACDMHRNRSLQPTSVCRMLSTWTSLSLFSSSSSSSPTSSSSSSSYSDSNQLDALGNLLFLGESILVVTARYVVGTYNSNPFHLPEIRLEVASALFWILSAISYLLADVVRLQTPTALLLEAAALLEEEEDTDTGRTSGWKRQQEYKRRKGVIPLRKRLRLSTSLSECTV
jgi:hypothetical protein